MTDHIKQEANKDNEMRQPTLEEIQLIKSELKKMYQKNFKKFIESLLEMPIHPQAMHQAFLFFDTGSLWMKEAIDFAPLVQKQPVENPQAPDTLQ